MGTRSLTYIYSNYKDDNDTTVHQPVVCMYRQYDGYPEGHGAELASFLTSGKLVNGLGMMDDFKVMFNGMGCLAAQMVAHFKQGAGGIYLHAPNLGRDDWQEYEYHVYQDKVIVYSIGSNNDNTIFDGSWADFKKFCWGNHLEMNQDTIKAELQNGVVEVTFVKTDGTERVMRATLNEGKIPEASRPKNSGKTRAVNPEVQPVFDLDEQHWKSFRWDSLVAAKLA